MNHGCAEVRQALHQVLSKAWRSGARCNELVVSVLRSAFAANIPWLTGTKPPGPTPSNDLNAGEFLEGAINLTNLDIVECFSTFLADSRSWNSLTADLKDFALGSLPLCHVAGSKVCSADPSPGVCLIEDKLCREDSDSITLHEH